MAFAKMQLPHPHFVGATALAVLLLACGSVSLGVTWWAGRRLVASPCLPPAPNTQPPLPCGMPLGVVTPAGQPCRMRFLAEDPLRSPQDGLLVPCTALCWSSSQSLFSGGFLGKAYVSRMKGSAAVRKAPHSGFHQTDDSCALWDDEAVRCPGLLGKLAGVGDPGSLCPVCHPWSGPIWVVGGHVVAPVFQPGRPGGSQEAAPAARVCWWV